MDPERLQRFSFERDGIRLAAYDSGGDGLPVVFQHGLCGDIRQVAEAFPDDPAFRLIALECRGHGASGGGASGGDPEPSIALFAQDVAALAESLGVARPVIGGISMGAAIASRLAVWRPDLVRALLLVRPAWVADPAPENMQPNAAVGSLLASMPPAEALAAFERSEMHARLSREAPDNLASLHGFFAREPVAQTAALLTAIAADGPGITEADLENLDLPVLVLASDADAIHPMSHAERLASLVPSAHLQRLTPKGGDKARYLADLHAALRTFLKGL